VPRHEVVIVGGGLAGLAAAWELRDRDVLLLEADDRLGGRVRSLARGPYWLNLGAHLLGGPHSVTRRLTADLGLGIVEPPGCVAAVALPGRVVRPARPESLLVRLAWPMAARLSLIRAGVRLHLGRRRVRRADRGAMLASDDPAAFERLPVDPALDALTFGEFLGPLHPDVHDLLRVSVNRSGGELHDTSAHYGIAGLFGAFAFRRENVVGGTERLIGAVAARVPAEISTGARVITVVQHGDTVRLEYEVGPVGGSRPEVRTVEAQAAIVATPAGIAYRVVSDLPEWKTAALARVRYAPFVVAGLFTSETAPMPWDDLYALATPRASFCMLFNPANALRSGPTRLAGGALVAYAAGDRARDLLALPDDAIRDRYLADLAAIFPATRAIVDDVTIARWEFGAPTPGPGRAALQPALAAPVGRIAFAGDYLQYAGLDSAMRSGMRAARLARAWLPAAAVPGSGRSARRDAGR
jgi:oxygen-dependent protoporphyrinogen oxidase